jgi:hypothetical protein
MKTTLTLFSQHGNLLDSQNVNLENGDVAAEEYVSHLFPNFRISQNAAGFTLRPLAFPGVDIPDTAVKELYDTVVKPLVVVEAPVTAKADFDIEVTTRGGLTQVRLVTADDQSPFVAVIDPLDSEKVAALADALFKTGNVLIDLARDASQQAIESHLTEAEKPFMGETHDLSPMPGPGEDPTPEPEQETQDDYLSNVVAQVNGLRYRGSFDSQQPDPWSGTYMNGDVVLRDDQVCVLAKRQWFKRALSADQQVLVEWLQQFEAFVRNAQHITAEMLTAMGFHYRGDVDDTKVDALHLLEGKEWDFWLSQRFVVVYISHTFITYPRNGSDTLTQLLNIAQPGKFKAVGATPSSSSPSETANELVKHIREAKTSAVKPATKGAEITPEGPEYGYLEFALAIAPDITLYRYLFQGPVQQLLESGFVDLMLTQRGWQKTVHIVKDQRRPTVLIDRDDVSVMSTIRNTLLQIGLADSIKPIRQVAHMAVPKTYTPMF